MRKYKYDAKTFKSFRLFGFNYGNENLSDTNDINFDDSSSTSQLSCALNKEENVLKTQGVNKKRQLRLTLPPGISSKFVDEIDKELLFLITFNCYQFPLVFLNVDRRLAVLMNLGAITLEFFPGRVSQAG